MFTIFVMGILFIIGFISICVKKIKNTAKHDFLQQFHEFFHTYVVSHGKDSTSYYWLIHRSEKMQTQLGVQGVINGYQAPYSKYRVNNYPVILNIIPEINKYLQHEILDNLATQYINLISETLVRHKGCLDDLDCDLLKRIKNPLIWFSEGVSLVVSVPFYLLRIFGVLSSQHVNYITSSKYFSVFSGLISFIGFVSAIITIVLGWDDFFIAINKVS